MIIGLGEAVTKNTFQRQLEGVPGTWVASGLHGSIIERSEKEQLVCLGSLGDVLSCASLGGEEMDLYRWDVLGTVLSVDQLRHIFQNRLHLYTVNIVHQPRLVLSLEITRNTTEADAKTLAEDLLESLAQLHNVCPFALTLHHPHQLPTLPDWRLDRATIKESFLKGDLEAHTVLAMPRASLEKSLPRAIAPGCVVGAAGMVCGSVISGDTEVLNSFFRISEPKFFFRKPSLTVHSQKKE